MKKIINSLFVIVASMVTFAGCQKEENNAPAAGETKTVQFFANSIETKTAFGTPDGKTYPTLWTENDEQVKILLNLNEEAVADVEISDDFTTASFIADVELGKTNPSVSPYQFTVISPATAYLGKTDARFAVTIPTTQTPLVNSVDEAAQILYAVSDSYEQIPGSVNLVFKHFTAYGNLSFTNLNLGDAVVQSVAITSSVGFANRWNYYPGTGVFEPNSAGTTITLTTNNTENLWFACAPVGDMNGKELTFTINTNKGPLSKTVTLAGDKYKFDAGKIAKMTVNMAGIEFAQSKVYELVTSVDDLTPESEIIIVATNYDLALSTTQNKNNRGPAAIDKSEDKSTISDPGSGVQVIVLEEGTVDGTFAFNVANGYLYAPGNDNHLKTTESLNENALWNISISSEGLATIKAAITGEKNWMRYNDTNSLFSCYASGQTDVSIYKRQGTGTTPLPKLTAPEVTAELSEDKTSIAVSWDAVEYATSYVISGVGEDVTTTEISYTFTEIEPGTYNITVKAVADGYKSSTSTAVSVVVPTVESGDEGGESTEAWTIVKDASTLAIGDQIVIVASGSNYALGEDKGNNRDAVSITKKDDTVVIDDKVQIITLEAGTIANTFAFNTGNGYLYAASSSSNYLKTKTTLDDNGSWLITIDANGVATIKSQGSYTRNWIRKNSNSALFACYASGQSDVSIYKLIGGNEGGGETTDPEQPGDGGSETPDQPEIPNPGTSQTVTLTAGDSSAGTWSNGNKTSSAKVGDVSFTALGTGGNDSKYYSSDNTWRFYTANSSGVKVSVPEGSTITNVVITVTKGTPSTPLVCTVTSANKVYTYAVSGSQTELSFYKSGSENLQINKIEVTYTK